jgi:hypothetical protein
MGIQKEKLYCTAGSTLERNRLVALTKSTNTVAYATYGTSPDGWLEERATANQGAAIYAIDNLWSTMRLSLETAVVTKGDPVFCGASGKVVGTLSYTVISRTQPYTQPAGSSGDKYIAPANVTAWTSPTQCVAGEILEKGASVWARTTATAGMLVYVTDEARYYVCSASNTWVLAKLVGYAAETGVAGEEIEVYNPKARARIAVEQLPNNINWAPVLSGQGTVTGSATTLTIIDERITSSCIVIASAVSASGVAPGTIKCVATTASLVITITAPAGSDTTVLNYVIFKQLS